MSTIILTEKGIENTNIDGARNTNFNAGNRSGIVKGAFNEGTFFTANNNTIALDTCELVISGHRIILDEPYSYSFNTAPVISTSYSLIAQIKVDDSSNVEFSLFVTNSSEKLIQENLFRNRSGSGTYQIKIGSFTHNTDNTISDVKRIAEIIVAGEKGKDGIDGIDGIDAEQIYDLVIRTQEEFEAWYTSLDNGTSIAKTILLVGDGGTLQFIRNDGQYINIPRDSVYRIDGINNAKIKIINSQYGIRCSNGKAFKEFSINGITVICENSLGNCYCFSRLQNLSNCFAEATITTNNFVYAFHDCDNLINCQATSNGDYAYGFTNCFNLVNCSSVGNGNVYGIGFNGCKYLSNCYGNGIAKQFAYAFYSCSYLSNCSGVFSDGEHKGLLGGSNTFVDNETVG